MGHSSSTSSHADSCTTEENSSVMLPVLPLAALEEVFMNVPAREVVCVCRLVCREWKELADSASLWRERCRREGLQPHDVTQQPEDWRVYYFLCIKRRNLLKNPKAEDKFNGWQILENGGDRWKIEDVSTSLPDETVKNSLLLHTNSFCWYRCASVCRKSQLINLAEEGYGPWLMDKIQPDIVISDWYSPRWDCGSEYEICVELLDQRKKVIQKFSPDTVYFEQWNDQQWQQMTHMFRDYGKGVRYVRFTHGGKDTQFWAGWYGIRVTNSSVEIRPRMNT